LITKQKSELAGLDIMETDVYTAGMPLRDGTRDRTYAVEVNILQHILKAY
jgi:hypothetical protein